MRKNYTNHPIIAMEENDRVAYKNHFRRFRSIACIACTYIFVCVAAGCAANTDDTAQSTSDVVTETDTTADTNETVDDTTANTAADNSSATDEATDNIAGDTNTDVTEITLDEAKTIALSDAGLDEVEVTYTAKGQDYDDGVAVYELDFYADTTEYDYTIQISDGAILEKSTEPFDTAQADTSGITSSSCINVDEAKAIVLNHAELAESDITLRKAMLEKEDGVLVYEFEFYYGNAEYEYTVNAETGDILNYEHD